MNLYRSQDKCGAGPSDCDVIVRGWQADTGGNARHAVSGTSFDELARLRAYLAEHAEQPHLTQFLHAWQAPA